jgi:hypothetical protein
MLIPSEAKYPTIHEEIVAIFSDLKVEYVACSMCGCDHPPELHVSSVAAFDPDEPEEA